MKKVYLNLLIILILFFFFASLGISQETESKRIIQSLSQNPKMNKPEQILEDFMEGKGITRVIINLQKTKGINARELIKSVSSRKRLTDFISDSQRKVIEKIGVDQVRVTNRFKYIFGFAAEVTLNGLMELAGTDEVISIEKDYIFHTQLAQGIPLIDPSNIRSIHSGAGVAIAICDTGIDYTHPMLGGGGFPNNKVIDGYDFGDNDADPWDMNGHGTCCASIAAGNIGNAGDYIGGVAYSAKIYALKISIGSSGYAFETAVISAFEWCITHQNDDPDNPIMIISLSFGGSRYFSPCDNDRTSLSEAAENVVANGITIFAASGNDGYCDSIACPACISNVISVGAVYDSNIGNNVKWQISPYSCVAIEEIDENTNKRIYLCVDETTFADRITCYSNSAEFLDILAPSSYCYTADIAGSDGYSSGDYFETFGGTSAACPYAAGAATCLQSATRLSTGSFLTPDQVRSKLSDTGNMVTDPKSGITTPRINISAALDGLSPLDLSWLYFLLLDDN